MFCNIALLLKVVLSLTSVALGQQYVFPGQENTRYIPNQFLNPTANVIPFRQSPQGFQRDSYLPQRDLQTSDLPLHLQQTLPQYRFTTKSPTVQYNSPIYTNNIVPSTHRPNYSYLFQQNHNHNPETEQFLGEITLQNPVDFTSKFSGFQGTEFGEKTKNRVELGTRANNNFLNYRTRIFAPDRNTDKNTQTRNYFVNEDGRVFSTTNTPAVQNETTLKQSNNSQNVVKNSFDLESLLENPKENAENVRNDDDVEVIKSKEQDEFDEEYDDYELTTENVNNEEYDDDEVEEEAQTITPNPIETSTQNTSEYVVLTMKPSTMVKDDNFKEFVDTVVIDTSTEEVPTTTEEQQEPIVSVVTTKSVINNTVVSTEAAPEQLTIIPDVNNENSTDTWVVVASVQTSRSVSGAHYLPSPIVEQDERVKLLNEHDDEEETTTIVNRIKSKTSTESLIDKLDRVQSDLSSGLLTNGFNDGNNIAVINETMSDNVTTVSEPTTKSPFPAVNIRKFTPHRPTRHPIMHSTTPKRATTTTREPELNRPQGDQPSKLNKLVFSEDLPSEFLPPDYKLEKDANKTSLLDELLVKIQTSTVAPNVPKVIKVDDVSKFLPPGYKPPKTTTETAIDSILAKAKPVEDISNLLPPGYKPRKSTTTAAPTEKLSTTKKSNVEGLLKNAEPVDISAFLPPGYKLKTTTTTTTTVATVVNEVKTTTSTAKPGGFKVVFPSRPGGNHRKQQTTRTTPSVRNVDEVNKPTAPTIHKGWPSRATTEFTGWPTPSTTPISIEKLLEAARTVSIAVSTEASSTTTHVPSTTTTTTTTTVRPTTAGVCKDECDLAGTIKLVGGAKWVPELLDRNTKEWQILANEVQTQLDEVFSKSTLFNKWYKKVRIDGFSKGSVLVDYLVELNDLGRRINTMEIKNAFHETLMVDVNSREGKSLNESGKMEGNLNLGTFIIDPKYTDFIVLPKQAPPTVGYAEDNVLLPQWAIAVIVIGLASLLFVIIFGVTVLVNRQKNAKKKTPTPLTEDMLHELNKNHMGGLDNFGANDLYSMEDVWNDRSYEQKMPSKKSTGSLHVNSMSNLYDSWRSEWNGYYYNNYYGSNPGSSQSGGKGRRRSDYDTNF